MRVDALDTAGRFRIRVGNGEQLKYVLGCRRHRTLSFVIRRVVGDRMNAVTASDRNSDAERKSGQFGGLTGERRERRLKRGVRMSTQASTFARLALLGRALTLSDCPGALAVWKTWPGAARGLRNRGNKLPACRYRRFVAGKLEAHPHKETQCLKPKKSIC